MVIDGGDIEEIPMNEPVNPLDTMGSMQNNRMNSFPVTTSDFNRSQNQQMLGAELAQNQVTTTSNGQSIYDLMSPEKKIDPIKNINSINNNSSTIDTLLERERDSSFLDRLDKQNKQNLKSSSFHLRTKKVSNKTIYFLMALPCLYFISIFIEDLIFSELEIGIPFFRS